MSTAPNEPEAGAHTPGQSPGEHPSIEAHPLHPESSEERPPAGGDPDAPSLPTAPGLPTASGTNPSSLGPTAAPDEAPRREDAPGAGSPADRPASPNPLPDPSPDPDQSPAEDQRLASARAAVTQSDNVTRSDDVTGPDEPNSPILTPDPDRRAAEQMTGRPGYAPVSGSMAPRPTDTAGEHTAAPAGAGAAADTQTLDVQTPGTQTPGVHMPAQFPNSEPAAADPTTSGVGGQSPGATPAAAGRDAGARPDDSGSPDPTRSRAVTRTPPDADRPGPGRTAPTGTFAGAERAAPGGGGGSRGVSPSISNPPSPKGDYVRVFRRSWPLAALFLLTLGLLAWQWIASQQRFNALEHALAERLATLQAEGEEGRVAGRRAGDDLRAALTKLNLLENKITVSQNQQLALETLYQELSRNRDEWYLADIEQMLSIASQQLQLAGNVRAAMVALEAADARLQRLDQPQLIGLRKVINEDIERLKALPYVDMVGMSLQLDALTRQVDGLPLEAERRTRAAQAPAAPAPGGPFGQFFADVWHEVKQLVQVRRVDDSRPELLAPSQAYFLRENLKLRLLSARLALLQRDEADYHADLAAAQSWLRQYFDTSDPNARRALDALAQLAASAIRVDLPDITASLNAVRDYKLSMARGGPG